MSPLPQFSKRKVAINVDEYFNPWPENIQLSMRNRTYKQGLHFGGSAPFVRRLSGQSLKFSAYGKYADPRLYRQKDNDAEASAESQDEIPLFKDKNSLAWASFSVNVAIARKSLQVRTF